ncbi:MAG: NAD(P)/FAD-dependent oxidoreductase [Blastocatellia bacterium]
MNSYDVIIIGGGPSGATASTLLAREGYRILLLEKSRFPRQKLCGEFITPECMEVFERLGVGDRLAAAGAKSIRRMTIYAPDGRGLRVPMEWIADGHSGAMGLSRSRMDAILLDRARESGVEVREGFHVAPRIEIGSAESIVEGKADGETVERFSGRVVIDASGRNGAYHHHHHHHPGGGPRGEGRFRWARFEGSRLFGCKVHLRGIEGLDGTGELYFFRDGYGGLSEVEGDLVNLCFITTEATLLEARGDRQRLLDLTMRTNPRANERLKGAIFEGEWLGTGPLRFGRPRTQPGVLAIGDAGAFIDPFTGSGILLALTSGEIAAAVIHHAFYEGITSVETIIHRYEGRHRAHFGLRYRISSMLRNLAFRPAARNLLVSVLSRHKSLMRLVARGTRQRLSARS